MEGKGDAIALWIPAPRFVHQLSHVWHHCGDPVRIRSFERGCTVACWGPAGERLPCLNPAGRMTQCKPRYFMAFPVPAGATCAIIPHRIRKSWIGPVGSLITQ